MVWSVNAIKLEILKVAVGVRVIGPAGGRVVLKMLAGRVGSGLHLVASVFVPATDDILGDNAGAEGESRRNGETGELHLCRKKMVEGGWCRR